MSCNIVVIMLRNRVRYVFGCFFFFKQKTAYEMLRSLVGSEMCIRDRTTRVSDYDYLDLDKMSLYSEADSGYGSYGGFASPP